MLEGGAEGWNAGEGKTCGRSLVRLQRRERLSSGRYHRLFDGTWALETGHRRLARLH